MMVASSRFHGDQLTYSYTGLLKERSVVTVPLRDRHVTAFVTGRVKKPGFATKPMVNVLSEALLPAHCLELARWMSRYYSCNLGDALSQFAPTRPTIRNSKMAGLETLTEPLDQPPLDSPLTSDQKKAIKQILNADRTTSLLHGETGTGKTRVYLELAKKTAGRGNSTIILTPEISLTTQLALAAGKLGLPVFVLHSHLSASMRKKIWLQLLENRQTVIVVGARSALFAPLSNIGLVILDEAHEPAYKQEQSPRYLANRVASQMGKLTGAKVVLGTATPTVAEYYLAQQHGAVITMTQPAMATKHLSRVVEIIDIKDRTSFGSSAYLSKQLINEVASCLNGGKQAMIYLNRRGTARLILCKVCGWEMVCPNCDIPLIYHGDQHKVRCHTCGYQTVPPAACPTCQNPDIIYRGIGTKSLADEVAKLFPSARVQRFDSDNKTGEQLNELYPDLHTGKIDILVGTQLLAKGLDLPKLGLVGVIAAESSLALPDFTSEERTFQLLYQILGRVGRGHGAGRAVVQTFQPNSPAIIAAVNRDYRSFYGYALAERRQFRFPPFAYLLKLSCRRKTAASARTATEKFISEIAKLGLRVEIIGPAPAYYGRRGSYYYWQVVVKSKNRAHLVDIAKITPVGWTVDLDPADLL